MRESSKGIALCAEMKKGAGVILVTDHSAKLPVFRFSYFVTREVVRLYFVTREVVRQCQGVCSLVDSLTVMLCA